MRTRPNRDLTTASPREAGLTMVEMLVLIAALALLTSIAIPTFSAAKQSRNRAACMANLRLINLASLTFVNDHVGRVQPASDPHWADSHDPNRRRWSYDRADGRLHDWASALLPYLGEVSGSTFRNPAGRRWPDFQCPTDPATLQPERGYRLVHGYDPHDTSPISYGVNYDIAGLTRFDQPDVGGFEYHTDASTAVSVYARNGSPHAPLNTEINRIDRPSQTMLFAECGTPGPNPPNSHADPLRQRNVLYYSTYTGSAAPAAGTLKHVYEHPSQIGLRIPLDRHDQGINVAFTDGHAAHVRTEDFEAVRLAP